jgi:hypothetical protein
MAIGIVLGDTRLTVQVARLLAKCPRFEESLPYQVRSPVRVEVFRIFLAALEGAPPVVTTENMNDLFLLCEEFGFASLLSQVTDFISTHSVAHSKARQSISDLEAKNGQQD